MSEELQTLKNIGPKTAEKISDAGYSTIASVAVMRPEELAEVSGLTKSKARETVNDAKEKALGTAIRLMTMDEYSEEVTKKLIKYTTGSQAVDDLIGGGITTNEITGIRGGFGTGKTQIAFSAAISTIQHGRKVAWIETEPGTFNEERLMQIAEARGVKINPKKDVVLVPSKFIISPNHQFLAYERLSKELEKGTDYGLIVVDSFSPRFREFYPLREQFPARSQETSRHLGFLQALSAKYNLAVLITVQIMGIPDAGKTLETMMTESNENAMYGGHLLKHSVQTWIAVKKKSKSGNEWQASLIDSSHMPPGDAMFQIGPGGVDDIQTTKGKG